MLITCRRTALHCAAYGGFTECLSVLLNEGNADINLQDAEGVTALHWACSSGHMETIQLLIGGGANLNMMEVDGERLTPLDYAIIGGHQEVAQLLIEQGAFSISSIRELAATMIQRCFRGYLVRKRVAPLLQEFRAMRNRVTTTAVSAGPSSSSGRSSRRSPEEKSREKTEEVDTADSEMIRRAKEEKSLERRR